MKVRYDIETKRVEISLTLREADTVQEVFSAYFAVTPAGRHSTIAEKLDIAMCSLPAVMLYFRNRQGR